MSDTADQYDDVFEDDTEAPAEGKPKEDGIANIRKALDKANKELKQYREKEKTSLLADLAGKAGLPENVANLRDFREAEDPAKWIEENRGLFAGAGSTENHETAEPTGESALPEGQVEEMRKMQEVQPGAYTPGSRDEMAAKVNAITATTLEEFDAELAKLGAFG